MQDNSFTNEEEHCGNRDVLLQKDDANKMEGTYEQSVRFNEDGSKRTFAVRIRKRQTKFMRHKIRKVIYFYDFKSNTLAEMSILLRLCSVRRGRLRRGMAFFI